MAEQRVNLRFAAAELGEDIQRSRTAAQRQHRIREPLTALRNLRLVLEADLLERPESVG